MLVIVLIILAVVSASKISLLYKSEIVTVDGSQDSEVICKLSESVLILDARNGFTIQRNGQQLVPYICCTSSDELLAVDDQSIKHFAKAARPYYVIVMNRPQSKVDILLQCRHFRLNRGVGMNPIRSSQVLAAFQVKLA